MEQIGPTSQMYMRNGNTGSLVPQDTSIIQRVPDVQWSFT